MGKRCFTFLMLILTLATPMVCQAADTDQTRFYLALRLGAAFFTDTKLTGGLEVPTIAGQQLTAGSVGLNLGRYWGLEVAADYYETDLNLRNFAKIGEYTVFTVIPQFRLRYPLGNGKVTPYVVGGAGWGFTEFNDPSGGPVFIDKGRETSIIGSVGGGIEYFVADNIAVGVEAKFLFFRDAELTIDGRAQKTDLDTVLLSAGLRIFFP